MMIRLDLAHLMRSQERAMKRLYIYLCFKADPPVPKKRYREVRGREGGVTEDSQTYAFSTKKQHGQISQLQTRTWRARPNTEYTASLHFWSGSSVDGYKTYALTDGEPTLLDSSLLEESMFEGSDTISPANEFHILMH